MWPWPARGPWFRRSVKALSFALVTYLCARLFLWLVGRERRRPPPPK